MSAGGVIPDWTLGWRLQRALDHAGIKVGDMADEIGVVRGTVSLWLHDKGPVREIYLKHWALRCGVNAQWLITGRRGETPEPSDETNFGWRRYSAPHLSAGRLVAPDAALNRAERAA